MNSFSSKTVVPHISNVENRLGSLRRGDQEDPRVLLLQELRGDISDCMRMNIVLILLLDLLLGINSFWRLIVHPGWRKSRQAKLVLYFVG